MEMCRIQVSNEKETTWLFRAQLGIFFYPVGMVRSHYKAQPMWSKMVVPVTPRFFAHPFGYGLFANYERNPGVLALFVKVKGCALEGKRP